MFYLEELPFDIEGHQRRFGNPHAMDMEESEKPVVDIGCYEGISQGLYIDKTENYVSEDSDCSFSVSLALEPEETVQVNIQKVSGPDNIVLQTPSTLLFNPAIYLPQQVTIRADEDNDYIYMDGVFNLSLTGYHSMEILVHEIDNDPDSDFNDDGRVDSDDLIILAYYWLQAEPAVDIMPVGGDGIVNIMDFSELAKNYGIH